MRVAVALSLALLLPIQIATAQPAGSPGAHVDTVTVEAPKTPMEKAVDSFVKSYAAPSMKIGKIPKWASDICPLTLGLSADLNQGVSSLLKQVAARVGAPVDTREPCEANVTIIFTRTPEALLDDMAKNHQELLGWHEVSQIKSLATMRFPIQAWYATATRDYNGTLRADTAEQDPRCTTVDTSDIYSTAASPTRGSSLTIDPKKYGAIMQDLAKYCGGVKTTGNHLNDGLRSEFNNVTILVDASKLDGLTMTPVSNYIIMLALSQTQAYATCQPLASITNMLAQDCDIAFKPNGLSDSDLAYLKALYKMNPDGMLAGQQSDIARQMAATLNGH